MRRTRMTSNGTRTTQTNGDSDGVDETMMNNDDSIMTINDDDPVLADAGAVGGTTDADAGEGVDDDEDGDADDQTSSSSSSSSHSGAAIRSNGGCCSRSTGNNNTIPIRNNRRNPPAPTTTDVVRTTSTTTSTMASSKYYFLHNNKNNYNYNYNNTNNNKNIHSDTTTTHRYYHHAPRDSHPPTLMMKPQKKKEEAEKEKDGGYRDLRVIRMRKHNNNNINNRRNEQLKQQCRNKRSPIGTTTTATTATTRRSVAVTTSGAAAAAAEATEGTTVHHDHHHHPRHTTDTTTSLSSSCSSILSCTSSTATHEGEDSILLLPPPSSSTTVSPVPLDPLPIKRRDGREQQPPPPPTKARSTLPVPFRGRIALVLAVASAAAVAALVVRFSVFSPSFLRTAANTTTTTAAPTSTDQTSTTFKTSSEEASKTTRATTIASSSIMNIINMEDASTFPVYYLNLMIVQQQSSLKNVVQDSSKTSSPKHGSGSTKSVRSTTTKRTERQDLEDNGYDMDINNGCGGADKTRGIVTTAARTVMNRIRMTVASDAEWVQRTWNVFRTNIVSYRGRMTKKWQQQERRERLRALLSTPFIRNVIQPNLKGLLHLIQRTISYELLKLERIDATILRRHREHEHEHDQLQVLFLSTPFVTNVIRTNRNALFHLIQRTLSYERHKIERIDTTILRRGSSGSETTNTGTETAGDNHNSKIRQQPARIAIDFGEKFKNISSIRTKKCGTSRNCNVNKSNKIPVLLRLDAKHIVDKLNGMIQQYMKFELSKLEKLDTILSPNESHVMIHNSKNNRKCYNSDPSPQSQASPMPQQTSASTTRAVNTKSRATIATTTETVAKQLWDALPAIVPEHFYRQTKTTGAGGNSVGIAASNPKTGQCDNVINPFVEENDTFQNQSLVVRIPYSELRTRESEYDNHSDATDGISIQLIPEYHMGSYLVFRVHIMNYDKIDWDQYLSDLATQEKERIMTSPASTVTSTTTTQGIAASSGKGTERSMARGAQQLRQVRHAKKQDPRPTGIPRWIQRLENQMMMIRYGIGRENDDDDEMQDFIETRLLPDLIEDQLARSLLPQILGQVAPGDDSSDIAVFGCSSSRGKGTVAKDALSCFDHELEDKHGWKEGQVPSDHGVKAVPVVLPEEEQYMYFETKTRQLELLGNLKGE